MNVIGPGADLLIIDANEASRVFAINAGVQATISGLNVTGGGNVDSGGGIKNLGDHTLDSVVVSGNHTILNSVGTNVGGGIYSLGGSLRVINSTIVGNQGRYGGGLNVSLANDAVFEVKGSTIADNYGLNTPAPGSAADGLGGGLLLGASAGWTGTASILNSTFSGNRSAQGAGLSIHGAAASATIVNSTIAYNHTADAADAYIPSGYAGGIQVYLGGAKLHNTIVAQNESGNASFLDVWGSLSGGGTSSHNLIGQTADSGLANGAPLNNQVGGVSGGPRLNPMLSPTLADNGGPTKTHAPLPTSPVIDAGSASQATAAGLTNDQRGPNFKRQVIGGVDIGAVEAYVARATPTSAIVIHGTDSADGITIGSNVAGQTVVALDSTGGVEMPVSLASAASVTVYANGGDDAVSVESTITKSVAIYGGDGDDLLVGGGANDVIYGGLGADSIHGGAGADTLYANLNAGAQIGGDGADSLFGNAGIDQLYVEFGSDVYEADSGEVSGQNAPAPAASNWNTFIKNENTGFGAGWDLAPLDRLLFNADPNQPGMIRWVGTDGYFNDFAGFGVKSATDESASVLSDATGSVPFYVRRDKFGNTSYYSTATACEGVLLKSVDRLGVGYQYVYGDHDGDGKTLEIESVTRIRPGQLGETTVYHYDGSRIDTVTDVFGRVTNLYYSSGQLQQIVLPAPDSSQPSVRPTFSFTYDWRGLVSSTTDADQRVTTFSFDHGATGELTITYPDGGVRKLLPAREDFYDDWRSQLGSWGAMLPTFKYKSELDQPGNKYGYQIDELNRTSTYTINGQGQVVETKDAAGQVTLSTRNSAGLPTQVTDKSAGGATVQVTGYQYDANHNLSRIDYFDGTFETWAYDTTFSQRTEHVDQLGRKTLNTVDPATGNTTEVRTVVGQDDRQSTEHNDVVTQYQYEADGLVKSVAQLRSDVNGTAQLSFAETYAYTSVTAGGAGHVGRWWQSTSYGGDNSTISGISLINAATASVIARNAYGMPTTIRDEVNRDTQYAYDNLDRLTKVTLPNPGDGQLQPVTEYAYTLSGLLQDETRTRVGAIAAERITTHLSFDANGRVQNVYEDYGGADQALTAYTYDAAGNVTQTTDARNQQTQFTYDVLDRLIRIQEADPDGVGLLTAPVTMLAYDALGRLVTARNPIGQLTRGEYDRVGRLVQYIAPLGAMTALAYDAAGQQTSQIDPEGRASSYLYDDAGRIVATRAPGHVQPSIYKYDSASNLRFGSDPLTNTAEYIHDERGRLVQEKDENGKSVHYGYTNANELQTLTDPNLNETTWVFDGAGRVKSETNELGHARTYKYDAYNRLSEKTDRNGRVTKFEYDRLDYLAAEKWYVGTNLQRTISYDFDKVGNLELVSDPSATYDYEYDGLARQTGVTQTIAGLTPTVRFDHGYDAAGRMTSSAAKIGGVADYGNSYSYDALGRLAKLTQAAQVVTGAHAVGYKRAELAYNKADQLTSVSRFSSSSQPGSLLTSAYSYDAAGRIEQIAHGTNVTHSYAWSDADRLTSYANSIDGSAAYEYDDRGQIIAADYAGAWTQWLADEAYDYDDNGNPQLATGVNNLLLSDGAYHYQYDNEGNRIVRFVDNDANGQLSDGDGDVTFYSWDHRNRLVGIVSYLGQGGHGGHIVTLSADYAYDPLNQQIKRVADPDGYGEANSEQTFFLYEDGQIVLQFDKTGAGDAVAADLSHRYLWGASTEKVSGTDSTPAIKSAAVALAAIRPRHLRSPWRAFSNFCLKMAAHSYTVHRNTIESALPRYLWKRNPPFQESSPDHTARY